MLHPEDLEGIFENSIGKVGVRLIDEYANWGDFDGLEKHILDLHDWMVKSVTEGKSFDKVEFMEKLKEHNAVMAESAKKISIGRNGEPSLSNLFGDMQVKYMPQVLYELAKCRSFWIGTLKANKIMRVFIDKMIRMAIFMESAEFRKFIEDNNVPWIEEEEIKRMADLFATERHEEKVVLQQTQKVKKETG